jgi:Sec-independent protein translocase protein TatA
MFDTLLQPTHLLILSILCLLLLGRRLPDIARWLGRKSVEFRFRRLFRSLRKTGRESEKEPPRDDEDPGACPARLEPPDKPRPPAQVALTPPKSSED